MAVRSLQLMHRSHSAARQAPCTCATPRARQQPQRSSPGLRKLAATPDGKEEPPWARANATEPPPWERKERERALATEEPSELPFGAYLLASVLVAIAAVRARA